MNLLIYKKWIGGGGHINRDIVKSKKIIFSAQLLNEEQNITPTIIGVCLDEEINNIIVRTEGKSNRAIIYDTQTEDERFYRISLSNNVANNTFFIFEITYKNNNKVEYIVSKDVEISRFQKGKQLYFYNE